MKRAFSFDYSSDEDDDALLAQALDDFERHMQTNAVNHPDDDIDSSDDDWMDDDTDDEMLARYLDDVENQQGGALPGGPLFSFDFTPIGQRRRWRNVVRGQSFNATLAQLRDARPTDNVGEALTEALRVAINRELRTLEARPHDHVNFSMTAHGFTQAFQSVNFAVREFLERSLRLDTLLQSLADKLNSNEEFNPQQGFEVMLSVIAMPTPGSGRKKHNPGRKCLERTLQKKRAVVTIKNQDDLCCARAIVTMRAWCHRERDGESKALWDTLRHGYPRQTAMARELHQQAIVPEGPCGLDELTKFQDALGNDYQLLVMCMAKPFLLIFKGPPAPHSICLLKANDHYNGCTSFKGFLNKSYYCTVCEKGYDEEVAKKHSCKGRVCKSCNRTTCPDYRIGTQPTTRCPRCNCLFFGPDCLLFHQSGKTCDKYRTCPLCQSVYGVNPKKRHQCGMAKCPSCEEFVQISTHRCFIQPVDTRPPSAREGQRNDKQKEKKDPLSTALFVYADIEAMQLADRSFEANMLCYRTSEEEEIKCLRGPGCVLSFLSAMDELTEKPPEMLAEGEEEDDDDEDDDRLIFILFHNLKGFDGNFILRALYDEQRSVTAQLTVGAKVLSFQSGPLTFKDSLCFLPMPLASFSQTFGITELKKGYFPHAFNVPENQSYVGRIPNIEFYDPEGFKDPEAKREFERWHADQVSRGVVFNFQSEMEGYCNSDVALLQAGCEAFCKQFGDIAKFNPMAHCVTIASACNLYWRREQLEQDLIAVEPLQGWRGARVNQSKAAFQWLYYRESLIPKEGAAADRIRHARNGGEQRVLAGVDTYFVDGYDPVTRTVYEFHGCLWHGCRSCYPRERDIKTSVNADRTLNEIYVATQVKMQTLRAAGYTVVEMWECQWKRQLEDKTSAASPFVQHLTLADPLQPREAFFGGRTGAVALYAVIDERTGEVIRYIDVTSLYPWVNKTAKYPVGHPVIITNPGHLDIGQYFGVALVDILPPTGLFHPVLPVRSGGKLTFPLCGACVKEEQAKPFLERRSSCAHSNEARTLRGTWCTPEIDMALSKGYTLLRIHEVWHFPQTRVGLFAGYVNTWLKLKQESAGWPGWCTDESTKQQYIRQYKEREGIDLDPNMVRKNPGRKATAKLMLNSFWGKFGERQNKPCTEAVYSPVDLYSKLISPVVEVSHLRFCTDDVLEIVYTRHADDATPSNKVNIFIAAFTTCWARLKLYSYLDSLGERVLYYDTDSVIYRQLPGQVTIPIGDFLGDMTDELDGDDHIIEFVSGGAKNYGYVTKEGKKECKVRGFTLNVRGRASLNYEVMKANILAELDDPLESRRVVKVVNPNHFKRDQASKRIGLVEQTKQYGLVFDKRVVDPETKISVPFGFSRVGEAVDALMDLLGEV